MRSPRTATGEWPLLAATREKPAQQRRPNTAKNKIKNVLKTGTYSWITQRGGYSYATVYESAWNFHMAWGSLWIGAGFQEKILKETKTEAVTLLRNQPQKRRSSHSASIGLLQVSHQDQFRLKRVTVRGKENLSPLNSWQSAMFIFAL